MTALTDSTGAATADTPRPATDVAPLSEPASAAPVDSSGAAGAGEGPAAPGMTREAWLEARRSGVGGSDVAAILGLNPYRTPLQVWLDKVQGSEDFDNDAMEWGRRLESVVADKFTDAHPDLAPLTSPGLIVDGDDPIYLANPDRIAADGSVIEIKTAGERAGAAWEDGATPDAYVMQLQWYLGVLGAERGWMACLIGGRRYVERELPRDDRLIEAMRTRVAQWWARHVEAMVPPPATPPNDDRFMARAYPATERAEVVLDADTLALVDQARTLDVVIANLTDDYDRLTTLIKERLAEATDGLDADGTPVVTWRPRKGSTRVDTARLKAEHPDVYAALATTSNPTRTFRLIEGTS